MRILEVICLVFCVVAAVQCTCVHDDASLTKWSESGTWGGDGVSSLSYCNYIVIMIMPYLLYNALSICMHKNVQCILREIIIIKNKFFFYQIVHYITTYKIPLFYSCLIERYMNFCSKYLFSSDYILLHDFGVKLQTRVGYYINMHAHIDSCSIF